MKSSLASLLLSTLIAAGMNDTTPEQLMARGRFAEALPILETDRDAAKAAHNDHELATVMNNLGTAYYELGRYRDAQHAFEHSLALRRELGQSETREAAR